MPAKPVAEKTVPVISSAGSFAGPVLLPSWSDLGQTSSYPEDSLTFQKDKCYISLAFYLCDLVKIQTTIDPHLFSIFFHFTVVLSYLMSPIEVWSAEHSPGPRLWL